MNQPDEQFDRLFRAGDDTWNIFRERRGQAFHAFVPADYPRALEALRALRPRADTFLELGSGVGVITILAAKLGFEASGIEIDPWLVEQSEDLAGEFDADATFANGTFIPPAFQERVDQYEMDLPTILDGNSGYEELGQPLDSFDLVYAFYWPGLEDLFFELMAHHGREGALLLTYSDLEGYRLWSDRQEIALS